MKESSKLNISSIVGIGSTFSMLGLLHDILAHLSNSSWHDPRPLTCHAPTRFAALVISESLLAITPRLLKTAEVSIEMIVLVGIDLADLFHFLLTIVNSYVTIFITFFHIVFLPNRKIGDSLVSSTNDSECFTRTKREIQAQIIIEC